MSTGRPTDAVLAIEGGPPAVTSPIDDRWEKITERERTLVNGALESGSAVYDQIEMFEAEFRDFVGTRFALAVCNGTAALHSAMFAAGAALGREVIVPSVTWHASISPALHCGASPVFADADPETFCIDPADVRRKLTDRTCAIVATHVYGNPANLDVLLDIVDGTDITLIEDASHAHGARWRGKQAGSVGHIGCFSMQASKPISGVEAGVAVTNDPHLYDRMAALGHYGRVNQLLQTDALRDLGRIGLGVKYRANPLGIALARAGLERLPDLNERRRRWFARLDALLDDVPGVYPQRPYAHAERGGFLLYAARIDAEEIGAPIQAILQALAAEGVGIHPDHPSALYGAMHLQPLFSDFPFEGLGGPWGDLPRDVRPPCGPGSLPVSEQLNATCVWLPTPVDPSEAWVEQVAAAFEKVTAQGERIRRLAKQDA